MARPGGQLAALPLHFVWIADCSGSMAAQGKMASLNNAAREALPQMRKVAGDNPNAEVFVRVLRFSTGASWVVEKPTPVQYFQWPELTAAPGGATDLGFALTLLARELRPDTMPGRALPPVLVLLTDGWPTDGFQAGLDALMQEPWGAKALRIGIKIGTEGPTTSCVGSSATPRWLSSTRATRTSWCAASGGRRRASSRLQARRGSAATRDCGRPPAANPSPAAHLVRAP